MKNARALTKKRMQRVVGPPPDGVLNLSRALDQLYHFDAAHHARGKKGDKLSQRVQDLKSLAELGNGELPPPPGKKWTHHCWDTDLQRPCCDSQENFEDKVEARLNNVCFAEGDPIPSENTWTHTMANFKKTITRKLVNGIGTDSFPVAVADAGGAVDAVDGEATGDFQKIQGRVRMQRT